MTNKTILTTFAFCAGFVSIAMAEPAPKASGLITTPLAKGPITPVPDELRDKLRACRTDLTISRMVLTRSGPTRSILSISVVVKNLGPSNFVTDPRQAGVAGTFTNGRTNVATSVDHGSIGQVRAGATITLNSLLTTMPFDTSGLGGSVVAALSYDPDIGADAQPCNDDTVYTNNTFTISNATVRAWLATTNNRLDISR